MPSKVLSVELHGLEGFLVEIEADRRGGLPKFSIVGLPDAAVQEAKERVQSAIVNSGFNFPLAKVVVNLAPGDLKKSGPRFDLPIAVGVVTLMNKVKAEPLKDTLLLGELALDGTLRPITGVLASVETAKKMGFKQIILPAENAPEAALIPGIRILPAETLRGAVMIINGKLNPSLDLPEKELTKPTFDMDMSLIRGQAQAKRALEIVAAGGHNLLLCGAPGAGKTLMARTLGSILPTMTLDEMLEVSKIYSVAGLLPKNQPLITRRPFRLIHHTASAMSIVGGGNIPGPGEVSLAHRGILFLDEMAEFPKQSLEVLRQPLEDRFITVSRVSGTYVYPCQFTLVAAMNPCPCGYRNVEDSKRVCNCSPFDVKRYEKRISGPFMDRIDLFVNVKPVDHNKLVHGRPEEPSGAIRQRVENAVKIQRERFKNLKAKCNAEIGNRDIERLCPIGHEAQRMLSAAVDQMGLSARGYFRILKVARTIADLGQKEKIETVEVAEALQYRSRTPAQ